MGRREAEYPTHISKSRGLPGHLLFSPWLREVVPESLKPSPTRAQVSSYLKRKSGACKSASPRVFAQVHPSYPAKLSTGPFYSDKCYVGWGRPAGVPDSQALSHRGLALEKLNRSQTAAVQTLRGPSRSRQS